jgi:hypothetical protein
VGNCLHSTYGFLPDRSYMEIAEQLTDIYFTKENWHKTRMNGAEALKYHHTEYENGNIHVYEEEGKVLGYYERSIIGDTCFLKNVWIDENYRHGKVFKELYKHFFSTMPTHIKYIIGDKVKLGGRFMRAKITRSK